MKMTFFVVLLMVLTLPAPVLAGEKGKLVSLLADYTDLKQRVQEIRAARKDGYSSDSKEMIDLRKEILAATKEVQGYHAQLGAGRREEKAYEVSLALEYAYDAMLRVVSMELHHNLYKSSLAITLEEKYADIWQIVDPSIPVFSAP